jgi:hypothetical protein
VEIVKAAVSGGSLHDIVEECATRDLQESRRGTEGRIYEKHGTRKLGTFIVLSLGGKGCAVLVLSRSLAALDSAYRLICPFHLPV